MRASSRPVSYTHLDQRDEEHRPEDLIARGEAEPLEGERRQRRGEHDHGRARDGDDDRVGDHLQDAGRRGHALAGEQRDVGREVQPVGEHGLEVFADGVDVGEARGELQIGLKRVDDCLLYTSIR